MRAVFRVMFYVSVLVDTITAEGEYVVVTLRNSINQPDFERPNDNYTTRAVFRVMFYVSVLVDTITAEGEYVVVNLRNSINQSDFGRPNDNYTTRGVFRLMFSISVLVDTFTAEDACPNGWYNCNGRCYGLFTNQTHKLTWVEARESCWSKDAFLAAITNDGEYGRVEEACMKETLRNLNNTEPLPYGQYEPQKSIYAGLMTGARTCDLMVKTINHMKTSEVNITWSQAECTENVTDAFMCVKVKESGLDQDNNSSACLAPPPCSCSNSLEWSFIDMLQGEINCENLGLSTMPIDILQYVRGVFVRGNKILYIENGMFHGMPNLKRLDLGGNEIHEIFSFGFKRLSQLEKLYLYENKKRMRVGSRSFGGLHKLKVLRLSRTFLEYPINSKLFQDLTSLVELSIAGCDIKRAENMFLPNPHLVQVLDIDPLDTFNDMFRNPTEYKNLDKLHVSAEGVSGNKSISDGQFDGLNKLKTLILDMLDIPLLQPAMFGGLDSLTGLILAKCQIYMIEKHAFSQLRNLELIMINQKALPKYPVSLFQGLDNLTYVSSYHVELCCIVPTTVKECYPQLDHLSSCGDLVKNDILRVSLWTFGICILLGNSAVILFRYREAGTQYNYINRILIMNLSLSDMIMGIYIIIMASTDIKYRGIYIQNRDAWIKSGLCMGSGFIASLSSEMSVYILVVMTLDRFLKIVFPFKIWLHFSKRAVQGLLIVGWTLCITLTALPLLPLDYFSPHEFYTQTGFCLPLMLNYDSSKEAILNEGVSNRQGDRFALDRQKQQPYSHFNGWEYSFALFNVVNLLAFLLIATGYLAIFVATRIAKSKTNQGSGQEQDRRMALKLMWIVATDFCCWVPVIIMGFLTYYKVALPGEIVAYVSIYILPINSAINPILYTFSTLPWNKLWARCKCRSAPEPAQAPNLRNTRDSDSEASATKL
ncbi:unnamed protein product [Owenia fusiformis]|uniref:G-protein coupled receptors family 1 profile domain-containing protein n=1 Tax=Owenia fusiformis TaxID=6347 RepID=A0A8S4Q8X2_OWEFU|nr:unnamed protein product [Owenia fusiformis]